MATSSPHPASPAPEASEGLAALTEANVREALRAMRFAKPLAGSPLLGLALLDAELEREGLEDASEARAWLLQRTMEEEGLAGLGRARGLAAPAEALAPEPFLEAMAEDFRVGDLDLEAWSTLCLRHVVDARLPNPELADRMGVTKRTIIRRLGRGYALMTERLRERELLALSERAARRTEAAPVPPAAAETARERGGAPSPAAGGATAADRAALRAALLETPPGPLPPPDALARIARSPAADLDEQRLGRVATWAAPRYRLDTRFVALTVLVDEGEEALAGRWQARPERYEGLAAVLAAVPDPTLVVLGAPGAGKSTLLRRLEMDTCQAALRGETARVTLFASLSAFAAEPGAAAPSPLAWLAETWSRRHPRLAPLEELLAAGRVLLLLDGLNEMPHRDLAEYRDRVASWKRFLQEGLGGPGNRAVFSCRSLDYSAPLSTPELRVPQVRVEPLDDEGIRDFARAYGGERAWAVLAGSPHRDLVRTPYMLRLLVESLQSDNEAPLGPAALLTGYLRRALRRELERDLPALSAGGALSERDLRRIAGAQRWRDPYELPSRGPLIGGLESLAYGMQAEHGDEESKAIQVLYDEALDLVGGPAAESVIEAGLALAVLDEDRDRDELLFFHQLIQEYFAARRLARSPEPARARVPWRAAEVEPTVPALLEELGPGEPLPPLPGSGWEETVLMAAAMTDEPEPFLDALAEESLVLAGRAAYRPDVAERIPGTCTERLRGSLVERLRDPDADLRARVAAGRVLGRLGDPRFETRTGPDGPYRMPPLVEIQGGRYPIGHDELIDWRGERFGSHGPAHEVELAPFALGRHAVTNGELGAFVVSGGYEDERWWRGEVARAWWRGEGTADDLRQNNREWRDHFRREPAGIDRFLDVGTFDEETAERWRRWCALDDEAFEAALVAHWPEARVREPRFWRDRRYNRPSDPVVGISWYEARAYCAWLAAQSGLPFRLPTEVEWEAAARGRAGRWLPYGETYEPLAGNTIDAHLFGPSPVGAFPESDTPEGITDLSGNTWDWTSSAWGVRTQREETDPDYPYPYDPEDGREDPELPPEMARVARGGAWNGSPAGALSVNRNGQGARYRVDDVGLRVALSL